MARPKKSETSGDEPLMSAKDIIFMRDNVITGLSNLESGVHELRRTYITYFNSRLPEGHPARVSLPFFPATGTYDAENPAPARPRAETPGAFAEGGAKKKRKPHDPNAPKRALTSYFLFMQHNKPKIKEQNPDWTAAQVSAESEKLWENITEEDKASYEYMYQVDLARYYKQKEAYEAGEPIPVIDADEARRLWEEQQKSGQPPKGRKGPKPPTKAVAAPAETTPDATASSTPTDDDDDDDEEEEEEEAPPPAKAPTPAKSERASKRQKTAKESIASKAAEKAKAKAAAESPVAERVSKSPEKERKKRSGKKKESKIDTEDLEEPEAVISSPVKTQDSQKKEKKKSKKRKSEAVE